MADNEELKQQINNIPTPQDTPDTSRPDLRDAENNSWKNWENFNKAENSNNDSIPNKYEIVDTNEGSKNNKKS